MGQCVLSLRDSHIILLYYCLYSKVIDKYVHELIMLYYLNLLFNMPLKLLDLLSESLFASGELRNQSLLLLQLTAKLTCIDLDSLCQIVLSLSVTIKTNSLKAKCK